MQQCRAQIAPVAEVFVDRHRFISVLDGFCFNETKDQNMISVIFFKLSF